MQLTMMCALILALALPAAVGAQPFTPYPRSTLDPAASDAATTASGRTMQVRVYTPGDPFETVVAFHKSRHQETACGAAPKLPNGQRVRWACFVLDEAEHLWTSKSWMKVQRPYVGQVTLKGATPHFTDVRDATVIETVEKR